MGVADNLTAPERLTAVDLACVVRTYRDALVTHRAALNRLNVYVGESHPHAAQKPAALA